MQLKDPLKNKPGSLSAAIAAAACGLLGALPTSQVQAEEAPKPDKPWTIDSALLYYGESDSRVKDASLKSAIRRVFDGERSLNLNLSVDTLTGASPTGAVPSDTAQTFTRPSGQGSYQTAAGDLPLDDTFHDTRYALAVNWAQPVGEVSRLSLGVSGSSEYDYLHIGGDVRFERDFNQRNTTLFAGAAYGSETIEPEGGTPSPFAPMQATGSNAGKLGSDSKTVIDGLVGFTQILSRRQLVSLTYAYSVQDGYLNDPFKILSVVDGNTGRPVAGPVGSGLRLYRFESRPDSRTKQSLYAEWRYALDRDSLGIGYRLMTDDWGITSSTLDAHYRWNLSSRSYLEPQARLYQQSAADFYRSYLIDGQALPQYASADYRLAKMTAITAGFKYGYRAASGEYSLRLEYYKQDTSSDDAKIGVLANYDLAPSLSAVIVQFGYKFGL
jgi:hypothetical protein